MVERFVINYDARGEQKHPNGDFVHWPDYQAVDSALTAANKRIEELTRALGEARQYVEQIVTDQFQDIDGSIDVLPRIDAILASKQGGER